MSENKMPTWDDLKIQIKQLGVLLEKHRNNFMNECFELGYDQDQAKEMLSELECGDD